MWYEALPSLILTGAFVCLPYGIVPLVHKLFQNGNVRANDTIYFIMKNLNLIFYYLNRLFLGFKIAIMKGFFTEEILD